MNVEESSHRLSIHCLKKKSGTGYFCG